MSEGISVILLTKNNAKILPDLFASLESFLREGDEVVVVDTGSTDATWCSSGTGFCCGSYGEHPINRYLNIIHRPDLSVPGMHDLVKQYLPDQADKLTEDPQFKDGFLADFAAARQIATDAAKNDLVFWIDSDDVLDASPGFRDWCAEFFSDPTRDSLFLSYDYSFDEDGKCNTVLWRERILRRSKYKWVGVCHESMIPKDGVGKVVHKSDLAKIVHKHGRHHTYSDIRNYAILRHAHDTADWKDPRWDFYLGNACRGLSMWKEAVSWYTRVLTRSGSREDRLSACLNIAYTYILHVRPWRAIDWFMQAIKICPNEPRAYFGIARCYFELKNWQNCILFTELGKSIGVPPQLTSVDPNAFDYYPGVFECLSLKELGRAQDALTVLEDAEKLRPGHPVTVELGRDVRGWAQAEQIKSAVQAATSLAFSQEGALDIVKTIRPEIRKQIPELQIEAYCTPPKKSITFLCGVTHEAWDPTVCQTGVGGSEKMVILLSREFAKAGYKVDVYGNPRPENRYKVFDGVTYRPAQSFNPTLERDVLIIWRNWGYLDLPCLRARKIFMDLHDVQSPGYYTPERLAKLDGAFFKSNFHLAPVKDVIGDKAIVSRNGIDPEHFKEPGTRDYKRIVYTSSGDRGLQRALKIFARVKAIQPEATFHAYYGFTPLYLKHAAEAEYQTFGDYGHDRHMLDYMEECYDLGDRCGAQFHGRIGHQALAAELKKSSIVLYPTAFPEISCMSMMEAQAAGCMPVCSAFGALPETVKYGVLVHDTLTREKQDDAFVTACVRIIEQGADLDTYRQDMSADSLSTFDVVSLSQDWLRRFEPVCNPERNVPCITTPPGTPSRGTPSLPPTATKSLSLSAKA